MRLITLNTWGGKMFDPLMTYIKGQASSVDIFCFQEMFDTSSDKSESNGWRVNLFAELARVLSDHQGYFAPAQKGFDMTAAVDFPLSYGLATFVRKTIPVRSVRSTFVYLNEGDSRITDDGWILFPRVVQSLELGEEEKDKFTVFNFHGCVPRPRSVEDGPERQEQSKNVRKIMDEVVGKKILCGDYNLLPESVSMQILEEGMRNATKEGFIETTRPPIYSGINIRPDNIIVTKDLAVLSVAVPEIVVSDHYPIIFDFAL